jgi:hypothetical protein
MEHLDIDAQLIHMLQARRHIIQFSGRLRCLHIPARALREFPKLLFRQGREAKAPDLALDHPVLGGGIMRRGE